MVPTTELNLNYRVSGLRRQSYYTERNSMKQMEFRQRRILFGI
jgi:hypothetical protein